MKLYTKYRCFVHFDLISIQEVGWCKGMHQEADSPPLIIDKEHFRPTVERTSQEGGFTLKGPRHDLRWKFIFDIDV